MNRYKDACSLERKAVVETPSLTSFDNGIINQGFDAFSRGQGPSPSFFYIDNTGGWLDSSGRPGPRRFTESWIELEQAYSCGGSSSSSSKCTCCRCFGRCVKVLVYAIIAICFLGFAAIIAAILWMEIFHSRSHENQAYLEMPSSNFTDIVTASTPDGIMTIDIASVITRNITKALGDSTGSNSTSF